jgi:hypothetical protein
MRRPRIKPGPTLKCNQRPTKSQALAQEMINDDDDLPELAPITAWQLLRNSSFIIYRLSFLP